MKRVKDSFCSYCGTAYSAPLVYPRRCANEKCSATVWDNPLPVAVVLQPVSDRAGEGLLVIRRDIPPQRGKLALVGGFLEAHESWQIGAAREVLEETGLQIDPAGLREFWVVSSEPRPNRLLFFSLAPAVDRSALGKFTPNPEIAERGLIFGARGLEELFAFPMHFEAVRRFFSSRGIDSEHAFQSA